MFRHTVLTMSHPYRLPPAGRCDMAHTAKPTRENRTITVDSHDEATYFALLSDGKAFVEFVLAWSCTWPLRVNTSDSPGNRPKVKKFYKGEASLASQRL